MQRNRAVLLLIGALLVTAAAMPVSAAGADVGFAAVASADGVRASFESKGFFVVEEDHGAAPAAQATLDSAGSSEAFAAAPFPGDTVLLAPGLVAGQGGPQAPPYPFIARSDYPLTPSSSVDRPAYRLAASSHPDDSTATGTAGIAVDPGAGGRVVVSAQVHHGAAGEVTSKAETTADALTFGGGALRIGQVHSVVDVRWSGDARPTISSSMELGTVTVAGQKVGLTSEGVVPAGVALPGTTPADAVLAAAGLTVHVVAGRADPDGTGATSPSVEVTSTREVTGTAPTIVTYTIGRAAARVSPQAASGASSSSTDLPTAEPLTGDPAPPVLAAAPPVVGPTLPHAAVPTLAAARSVRPAEFSSSGFYLALAFAALTAVGAGQLVRLLGVRSGWK